MSSVPSLFCMLATPFKEDGSLDEQALRLHLRRMVDSGTDVYLGSGGAGEAHAMTIDELRRVYEIGVQECKGKVKTYANPREARTANDMYALCRIAMDAGVDMVQVYPVEPGHGMVPTFAEQEQYYRDVLDRIPEPVAISVHPYVGYTTPIALLKKLCKEYPQVSAINVMGTPMNYFVELKDALDSKVTLYTGMRDFVLALSLGSQGCLQAESNLAPRLCRSIATRWSKGDIQGAGESMANVIRLTNIVQHWAPTTARWVKMGMKVLGMGNGVLRRPYLLPPQSELDRMAAMFEAMKLRQIEQRS